MKENGKNLDKFKNLVSVDLNDSERDVVDKWYESHPYCTHAAYLSVIEDLKSVKTSELAEKKRAFFNSLPGKVFENTKAFTKTFYVFEECNFAYTNYDGWNCNTISFDIVGNFISSFRMGKLYITMENCSVFENMKKSDYSAIDEMSKRVYEDIKNSGYIK